MPAGVVAAERVSQYKCYCRSVPNILLLIINKNPATKRDFCIAVGFGTIIYRLFAKPSIFFKEGGREGGI